MNISVKGFKIVPFPGFYCGIYDISENLYCHEREEAEYFGVENIEEDVDYTFDYDGYKQSIADGWVEYMHLALHQTLGIDVELVNTEIVSPRYYNYANDRVYCDVKCRNFKSVMRKILALMDKHKDKLDDVIQANHTSYDGFISFMDNRFYKWREFLSNPKNYNHEDFSLYFSYVVTYLLMIEKRPTESIHKQADHLICEFAMYAQDFGDLYEFVHYTDEFLAKTREV